MPRRPILAAALTGFTQVPAIALLAAGAPAPAIALGALAFGVGMMFGNAVWESALQRHIRPDALSRVSAYDWFGSFAFAPVGFAIWGPIADAVGTSERTVDLRSDLDRLHRDAAVRARRPPPARELAPEQHAGVDDPGGVAALLDRAQQLEAERAVLGLQPRRVVAPDGVVVGDRRARGGDRVARGALGALPLAHRVRRSRAASTVKYSEAPVG